MDERLDIRWGDDERQHYDLLIPHAAAAAATSSSRPLLAFIHGGAWRSNSLAQFRPFARRLAQETSCTVASISYRLAPAHPHPTQALDVAQALEHVLSSASSTSTDAVKHSGEVVLVGHSAGAFIALQIALAELSPSSSLMRQRRLSSSNATSYTSTTTSTADSLERREEDVASASSRRATVVPPAVTRAVKGLVLVEGIYDLPSLLDEYPGYVSFVREAFGEDHKLQLARVKRESGEGEGGDGGDEEEERAETRLLKTVYGRESPIRWLASSMTDDEDDRTRAKGEEKQGGEWPHTFVLHSREDELLSLRQPDEFLTRARVTGSAQRGHQQQKTWLSLEEDYDSLKGKHDEVIEQRDELPGVVQAWLGQKGFVS